MVQKKSGSSGRCYCVSIDRESAAAADLNAFEHQQIKKCDIKMVNWQIENILYSNKILLWPTGFGQVLFMYQPQ